MRLSELGELGVLAELERRGLAEHIEDDAAELEPGLIVTQDSLVEGVHFRLDWLSWRELGFRAAAVNISDLAASGARPKALLVSLGLPGETELDDLLALYAGIAEAGVPVRGGDTTAQSLRPRLAPRGRGGDGVRTGAAARERDRERRFVRPPVRVDEGIELAREAHAMLDLSDGLAADAGHIARRSGCRLVIELEQVPLAPGATHEDLGFGEDFELLVATPDPREFTVIGRCEPGSGVEIRLEGRPVALSGWEHFRLREAR